MDPSLRATSQNNRWSIRHVRAKLGRSCNQGLFLKNLKYRNSGSHRANAEFVTRFRESAELFRAAREMGSREISESVCSLSNKLILQENRGLMGDAQDWLVTGKEEKAGQLRSILSSAYRRRWVYSRSKSSDEAACAPRDVFN